MKVLNPFDLNKIDDLPEELRQQLSKKFVSQTPHQDMLAVISQAGDIPLTIDEIMVGYYRTHNKFLDKKRITSRMYQLAKKGYVIKNGGRKRGERGVTFQLTKTDKDGNK